MVDLFNFDAPVVENKPQRVSDPNVFSPNPSKYPDKTFSCTLRFLPNPQNPNESCYQKYNVFMENPITHKKRLVEVVQGDGLTETFFELRNSPNPVLVERADMFSRKERYVSLVTIVKCDCQPDLVGKILVWSFPRAIKKLIDEQITPTDQSEESVNPFNVVQSNYLFLHISMQGRWPEYGGTKFGTKNSDATAVKVPMTDANGAVQMVPVTLQTVQNEAVREAFMNWLNNGPKLSEYAPKGYHDDEEKKFIWECISWAKNPNSTVTVAPQPSTVHNGQPAATPVVDSFAMNQMPINAAPTAAPQMASINLGGGAPTAAPQQPAAPAAQMPSGLEDVLGGSSQPQAQPSAGIAGGIALGDVLSGIM